MENNNYELGKRYILIEDYDFALYYFKKAAEEGILDAKVAIAKMVVEELISSKHLAEVINDVKAAAKNGNKEAGFVMFKLCKDDAYGMKNKRFAMFCFLQSGKYSFELEEELEALLKDTLQYVETKTDRLRKFIDDLEKFYNLTYIGYLKTLVGYYLNLALIKLDVIMDQEYLDSDSADKLIKKVEANIERYESKNINLDLYKDTANAKIGDIKFIQAKKYLDYISIEFFYNKIKINSELKQKKLDNLYIKLCQIYLFSNEEIKLRELKLFNTYRQIIFKPVSLIEEVERKIRTSIKTLFENRKYTDALLNFGYLSYKTYDDELMERTIKMQINKKTLERIAKEEQLEKIEKSTYSYCLSLDNYGISTEPEYIYYFEEYCNKETYDSTLDYNIRKKYELMINFKNRNKFKYQNAEKFFINRINNFMSQMTNNVLTNEQCYICSVPGHDQINSDINAITNLLDKCSLPRNFIKRYDLIKKTMPTEPKHLSKNERSWKEDIKSLKTTKYFDYSNKTIIVFDDISTTGSSLIAAKQLLYGAGAKNVICIVLAKTI